MAKPCMHFLTRALSQGLTLSSCVCVHVCACVCVCVCVRVCVHVQMHVCSEHYTCVLGCMSVEEAGANKRGRECVSEIYIFYVFFYIFIVILNVPS